MPKPMPKLIKNEEQNRDFLKKITDALNFSSLFTPEHDDERGLTKWLGEDKNWLTKLREYFGQAKSGESLEVSAFRVQIFQKLGKIESAVQKINENRGRMIREDAWKSVMSDLRAADGLSELLDNYNQTTDFRFVSDEAMQAAMGAGRGIDSIQADLDTQAMKDRFRDVTADLWRNQLPEDGEEMSRGISSFATETFSPHKLSPANLDKHIEDIGKAVDSLEKRSSSLEKEIQLNQRKLEALEKPALYNARTNLLMAEMVKAAYDIRKAGDESEIDGDPRQFVKDRHLTSSYIFRDLLSGIREEQQVEKELRDQLSIIMPADKIDERINAIKNRELESFDPAKIERMLEDGKKEVENARKQEKIPNAQADALRERVSADQVLLDAISEEKSDLLSFQARYTYAKKRMTEGTATYNHMKENVTDAINALAPFTVFSVTDELKTQAGKLWEKSSRGKKAGHDDSPEFKDMVQSLKDYQENPTEEKLKSIGTKAEYYLHKKNEGLHSRLFSSKMRYQRLAFAEELKAFAKSGTEKLQSETAVIGEATIAHGRLKALPFEKNNFGELIDRTVIANSGKTGEEYNKAADLAVSKKIDEIGNNLKAAVEENKAALEEIHKKYPQQKETVKTNPSVKEQPEGPIKEEKAAVAPESFGKGF